METYHHSDFRWNPSCGGERDPPDSIIFLKIEALKALSATSRCDKTARLTQSLTPAAKEGGDLLARGGGGFGGRTGGSVDVLFM